MKKFLPYISLFIIATVLYLVFMLFGEPFNSIGRIKTQEPVVYVGAWVGGFWDDGRRQLNREMLSDFEKNVGKKMAVAALYTDWTYLSNEGLLIDLNRISEFSWVPMVSSNPTFSDGCPEKEGVSLYKTVADGDCDLFLKEIGRNLAAYQKPVFLRFAWEMNLPNMFWSIEALDSTPEEFKAAWRRFHDILVNEGAGNVYWVLSFNTSHFGTVPYKDLYPGDEYVDWVAIDGYNWGDTQEWSGWQNFTDVFKASYNELIQVSKKPVMLSEVNSAPTDKSKAEWLTDMLTESLPKNFPRVKMIVFFNENKTEGESVDWRLERSPEYLEAVKKAFENDLYKSSYP